MEIKIIRYLFALLFISALFSCKKDTSVIPTVRVTTLTGTAGAQVNRLCFINSSVAFGACNGGKLIKSINGGNSWSAVTSFPLIADDLTDVQFTTGTNGFVIGGGNVYRTIDGGANWNIVNLGGNLDFKAMSFPDSTRGYISAMTGTYKTNNNGATWNQITDPDWFYEPYKMAFATRDTGLLTDYSNHYTYFTTDGGNTWTRYYEHLINFASEIKFISKTVGLAIGTGEIFKSYDAGVTWSTVQSLKSETEFMLSGVDVSSSFGFVVGDMSIFITKNNGDSWEYRLTDQGINLHEWLTDVHVINNTSAIASSKSGAFYKIEIGEQ